MCNCDLINRRLKEAVRATVSIYCFSIIKQYIIKWIYTLHIYNTAVVVVDESNKPL